MQMRTGLLCAALLVVPLSWPAVVAAEGALAVGLPPDVAAHGVAIGYSYNAPTPELARARALKACLDYKEAPATTTQLCRVIETYRRQCLAVSLDPDAGTPGVGWAIAPARADAEKMALAECRKTAGAERQKFCVLSVADCDIKP